MIWYCRLIPEISTNCSCKHKQSTRQHESLAYKCWENLAADTAVRLYTGRLSHVPGHNLRGWVTNYTNILTSVRDVVLALFVFVHWCHTTICVCALMSYNYLCTNVKQLFVQELLVSGRHSHKPTNYLCLVATPTPGQAHTWADYSGTWGLSSTAPYYSFAGSTPFAFPECVQQSVTEVHAHPVGDANISTERMVHQAGPAWNHCPRRWTLPVFTRYTFT